MSDNKSYGQPPPDANQDKNEPIGTSPETSAQSGESSRASMDQGSAPVSEVQGDIETDDATGAAAMQRSASPPADGGVPTPGDSQGVAVPSVQAAAGTSEQSPAADGVKAEDVKTTSLAPPGKPDGEVDTRAEATGRRN